MIRPSSADDFAAIHARLMELRRQRDQPSDDVNDRSLKESPMDVPRSGPASGKPGIPGWRVGRRRVLPS